MKQLGGWRRVTGKCDVQGIPHQVVASFSLLLKMAASVRPLFEVALPGAILFEIWANIYQICYFLVAFSHSYKHTETYARTHIWGKGIFTPRHGVSLTWANGVS